MLTYSLRSIKSNRFSLRCGFFKQRTVGRNEELYQVVVEQLRHLPSRNSRGIYRLRQWCQPKVLVPHITVTLLSERRTKVHWSSATRIRHTKKRSHWIGDCSDCFYSSIWWKTLSQKGEYQNLFFVKKLAEFCALLICSCFQLKLISVTWAL